MKKISLIISSLSLLIFAGCWKSKEVPAQEEPASAAQPSSESDDSLVRTEENPDSTKNMDIYGPGIGPDRTGPKP